MRVFIAENSSIIRERLAALLSDLPGIELAGYAEDVRGAVAAIRLMRPDVVILDIQMPGGGGGFSVLRDIREQELPATVIIFTNDPFPQYRRRFIDAGADFFLDKSAEFEALLGIFKGLSKPSNIERVC
jgi:DNA-binding NarL/FixJ family response regulator